MGIRVFGGLVLRGRHRANGTPWQGRLLLLNIGRSQIRYRLSSARAQLGDSVDMPDLLDSVFIPAEALIGLGSCQGPEGGLAPGGGGAAPSERPSQGPSGRPLSARTLKEPRAPVGGRMPRGETHTISKRLSPLGVDGARHP
jgi:hypothetical protein